MKLGARILIVEDDRSIARLVELYLEQRSFVVRCTYNGHAALKAAVEFEPTVIILDIMLPGLDGVGVLKELRRRGNTVPVIMLTARDTPMDKIHSLDLGADDYITKPFDMGELLARLRALVRRVEGEDVLQIADLKINAATREVWRGVRRIDLTAREFDLLKFLARHPRQVLSRDLLRSRVWGQNSAIGTNIVDVYIGYLRKKIDAGEEVQHIKTIWGVGYTLRDD
jgi:two-component system response regulator MprA/two-component system response regulator TrcR